MELSDRDDHPTVLLLGGVWGKQDESLNPGDDPLLKAPLSLFSGNVER